MAEKKNILIVFTGGTFSMKVDKKNTGGAIPRYSGEELLKKIPDAKKLANISCYDFGKYPGPHVTPEIMIDLSTQLKRRITEKKFDGIVITHGTDTLEETAYLLRTPANAKRLLSAAAQLNAGKGVERKLAK